MRKGGKEVVKGGTPGVPPFTKTIPSPISFANRGGDKGVGARIEIQVKMSEFLSEPQINDNRGVTYSASGLFSNFKSKREA
jgi:hypothetical protein